MNRYGPHSPKVLCLWRIIQSAIGENSCHIGHKEASRHIVATLQTFTHRTQVHRILDDVVVIGHIRRIYWF